MITEKLPKLQRSVQLIGTDQLQLNEIKPVVEPGPHQILGRVEVVGLCFSDLKLLKQFASHARKSPVVSGIDPQALLEMPQYVAGYKPTVPGHEAVVRIVKTGAKVTRHKVGDRCLVQPDYRWLPTAGSTAAFGYNFEGALQEYVLFDERVIIAPDNESMLISVPEDLSASALALCEPWGCVETSYVQKQRQGLKDNGQTLVVGESPVDKNRLQKLRGKPVTVSFATADKVDGLKEAAYDDVIYFGSNPATLEKLFPKIGVNGLLNIVQCGGRFDRPVIVQFGRVHYVGIRVVGTTGFDPGESMARVPAAVEIRPNSRINIIGAAGPMGTMHVIRALCQGLPGVTVFAGDLSDERLAALYKLAGSLAREKGLSLRLYNPSRDKLTEKFDYTVLMAPVPALAAQAIHSSANDAVINLFAGIPASLAAPIDLDAYIAQHLYFTGTSGTTLGDMKLTLRKVVSRQLNTDLSVAAISGLDGAIDGIRAVEKNLIPGKILVYPSCQSLKLTPLAELSGKLPLADGRWSKEAEAALMETTLRP